jgi:hypothetical protein
MSDDESAPAKMHSGYHGWMKSIPKTGQVRSLAVQSN